MLILPHRRGLISSRQRPIIVSELRGALVLPDHLSLSRAGVATYFDNTGKLVTASSNVARFSYNPSTLDPYGLLIEASRQNLLKSSGDLRASTEGNSVTAWVSGSSGTNAAATANAGAAPDGTNTATSLNDASASAVAGKMQTVSVVSGTTVYSGSVFFAPGTSSVVSLRLSLAGGTPVAGELVVDLSNGNAQWRTLTNGTSFFIEPINGGIYRAAFSITDNASGNNSLSLEIRPAWSSTYSPTSSAAATGAILAWGAQVSASTFSSSPIATTTAAVTRAADALSAASYASNPAIIQYRRLSDRTRLRKALATYSSISGETDMFLEQVAIYPAGTQSAVYNQFLTVDGQF